MKFLIDNSLSPLLSEALQTANHDAVHVRDYGLQKAEDEAIFARAANEDRVVVSTDTDFGTILVNRQASKPSVILFRGESPHRPELGYWGRIGVGPCYLANLSVFTANSH